MSDFNVIEIKMYKEKLKKKEKCMSENQSGNGTRAKSMPKKRFRSGRVSVAMFENKFQNDDGERISRMYSPQKSYKSGTDDEGNTIFKNSNSYNLQDLIHMRGIIDQIIASAYSVKEQDVVTEETVPDAPTQESSDVASEEVETD